MKNFKIGQEIKRLLLEDEDVSSVLGNKVFPIVADNGTTFPLLVYRRSSYRPYDNKDYTDEAVYIDITIAAETYSQSVDIADKVAECLNRASTDLINYISIVNINEDFIDNSYVQIISIEVLFN